MYKFHGSRNPPKVFIARPNLETFKIIFLIQIRQIIEPIKTLI